MTVILIAIAGLFLAGLARHSMSLALDAQQSQEELQRRWGELSCRQAILMNAENILERLALYDQTDNAVSNASTASVAARISLGEMDVELLLADESAKVSLNTIYRRKGREGVARIIRQQSHSGGVLTLHLRPYRSDSNTGDFPAFDSWGQVFSLERTENGSSIAAVLATVTRDVTCWGSGRLNLERAPDSAVEQVCRMAVPDRTIRELLELRKQHITQLKQNRLISNTKSSADQSVTEGDAPPPYDSASNEQKNKKWLQDLLNELSLREGEHKQLNNLLTDRSSCYSLWIAVRSKKRSWQRLSMVNVDGGIENKCWSFSW